MVLVQLRMSCLERILLQHIPPELRSTTNLNATGTVSLGHLCTRFWVRRHNPNFSWSRMAHHRTVQQVPPL